jgi:hypothetical protein
MPLDRCLTVKLATKGNHQAQSAAASSEIDLAGLIVPAMQVYSMLFFQLNINCYRVKSALIVIGDGASPQSVT